MAGTGVGRGIWDAAMTGVSGTGIVDFVAVEQIYDWTSK
jgi:hypothetical protein